MFLVILAAVAVGAIIVVGGNHTGHGFGHDMSTTGHKIERSTDGDRY
jgi:predicted small secreted protein